MEILIAAGLIFGIPSLLATGTSIGLFALSFINPFLANSIREMLSAAMGALIDWTVSDQGAAFFNSLPF